jgi:AAA+ ATPase superfamily predicted ATPase
MFIGRKTELAQIKEKLDSKQSEGILIYGRRRIGKTYLINEALKGFSGRILPYTFRDVPTNINVQEFCEAIASYCGFPGTRFKDLEAALQYLFSSIKDESFVLFLDEYSYCRRNDPGIDSYFQKAYDKFRHSKNIKMILCGSYMDIMKEIIDHGSPLFGRFSLEMQLYPFSYYESSLFCPDKTDDEKFRFYSFFGGSGFALSNLDFSLSAKENLFRLFLPSSSLFEREVEAVLNQEVCKVSNAKMILEGIALGRHKYKDINQLFSLDGGKNVSYLLKKLLDMDLISKVKYLNKKDEKYSLYFIKDNMVDFYYSFLFKNTDMRANLSEGEFYARISQEIEHRYLPRKFEEVSGEFLVRLNHNGLINPSFDSIGRYLFNDKKKKMNGEFNLVSEREGKLVDYECKYRNEPVTLSDYEEELEQSQKLLIPFQKIEFISRNGFAPSFPQQQKCYSLKDFYL